MTHLNNILQNQRTGKKAVEEFYALIPLCRFGSIESRLQSSYQSLFYLKAFLNHARIHQDEFDTETVLCLDTLGEISACLGKIDLLANVIEVTHHYRALRRLYRDRVEHWKALASTRTQIVDHLNRYSPAPYIDLLDRSEIDGHSGRGVLYWMSEYGQVVREAVSDSDSTVRLVEEPAEMIVWG